MPIGRICSILVAACTCCGTLGPQGCSAPAPSPNISLITVDTRRPDALAHYNGQTVPAHVERLKEQLKRHGYRTGAFVSGFSLQAMFGLDRARDGYDAEMHDGSEGWVERRAKGAVAARVGWFDQIRGSAARFGSAHFYDPHDPYAGGADRDA